MRSRRAALLRPPFASSVSMELAARSAAVTQQRMSFPKARSLRVTFRLSGARAGWPVGAVPIEVTSQPSGIQVEAL